MDLQELKFIVNTDDLVKAKSAVEALGAAVSKLNKPVTDNAKATAIAAKEQAKAEEAAAKAAVAVAKLEAAQNKATASSKTQVTTLEKQNMVLEFMTQGYSRGQASMLATAKSAGALTDEISQLGKVLQTQRTLMGTDPFDKSIGAMQSLKNEYTAMKEVQRLYNAGLGLSKTQMEDLAREKLRLIEKFKIEGKALNDVKNGLRELESAYVKNASAENELISKIKEKQRVQNDSVKAQEYISREMERINRLTDENGNITSATNNKLLKMEKALKSTGMSAEQQATKLAKYKEQLLSVQKAAGNKQVDYLSRALGPQITDVFVGLATGQSPLMVLLQQGGQLRDQFALAGVAGKDMGDMLVKAMGTMVTSVKDVAIAIGGLLFTAIVNTGKAVIDNLIKPFALIGQAITGTVTGTLTLAKAFDLLKAASVGFYRTGIIAAIATLATLAVEYIKMSNATTDLSRAIALNGAEFGMSTKQAKQFAASMAESGGSTIGFIEILTEFAKAGAKADEQTVTLAKNLKTYLGVSVEETAKSYAKLSEGPTKGLLEIAKAQGFISIKTLDAVHKLEQQGDVLGALELAQNAWKASNEQVLQSAISELEPYQLLWIKVKSEITSAGEAIVNFLKSSIVIEVLTTAWETFAVIISEVWYVFKQIGQTVIDLYNIMAAPVGTKLAVIDAAIEASKKAREEHDKHIESLLARKGATKGLSDEEVKQREANAAAANAATKRWEKEKESLDFFQSSMKSAKDLIIGTTQAQGELNDAERKYLEITNDPKYAKLSEARQRELKWLFDIAAVKVDQLKLDKMITEENLKLMEENQDLILQAKLIGASNNQRKLALKTRKAEVELQKELVEIEKSSKGDVQAARAAAYERYAQKVRNANKEISIELVDELTNNLTDVVMTSLTQGGKAGAKKLRELIKAELMKPVTIVVQAVIGSLVQSATGSLLSSAAGGAAGSTLGSALGSAAMNSAIATSVFGSNAAYGAALGTTSIGAGSQAAMLAAQTGEFGAAGAMSTASAAGTTTSLMTSVSAAMPYVAAALVIANGLGLFANTEQVGGGIKGTLGGNGSIQNYVVMREDGTLFSGPDYWEEVKGISEANTSLQKTFNSLKASATTSAKILGVSAVDIENFTKDIKLSFEGLTSEQIQQKITSEFETIANQLAEKIIGPFLTLIKDGETSSQALTRLVTSLTTVNNVLDTLNQTMLQTSLTGADAASKLADAFGGLDNLTSATTSYYEAFYTEEERNAKTIEQLTVAFTNLGLALPNSLKAFRDLVNQQDLYTDSGRNTYAALIGLSSAFAKVNTAAEDVSSSIKEAGKSIKEAGKSISEWLTNLSIGSTTGRTSLLTARSAYMSDLTLAGANDTTALGNITNSAKAYLDAAKMTSTSGAQYNAIVAKVVSQVGALPAVKNWNDEVLLKLGLISDYTDTTSTNTYDAYVQSVKQVDYLIRLNNDSLQSVFTAVTGSYGYYNTMITHLSSIATDMTAIRNTPAGSSGGGGGGIFSSIGNTVQKVVSTLSFGLFASGGVFGGENVYSQPTMFMQPSGQLGIMGEAGPEAVMPLERMADGSLGVRAIMPVVSNNGNDTAVLWQAIEKLNTNLDGLRAETRANVVNTSKTAKLLDRVVEADTLKVQTIVI